MPKRLVSPRMRQARIDHVNGPAKNPIVASARNHKSRDAVISAWQLDPYAPNPLDIPHANDNPSPKTVADFVNDYYRVNGVATTFDAMFTYSGASNKTMTDSDGNLKWAPHNYFTYTTDIDGQWVGNGVTNQVTVTADQSDVDGGTAAFLVLETTANDFHRIGEQFTASAGASYITKFVVKPYGSTRYVCIRSNITGVNRNVGFDLSAGVVTVTGSGYTSSIESLGNGWYLITAEVTAGTLGTRSVSLCASNAEVTDDTLPSYAGSTSNGYFVSYAALHRSDIGGMVNNPDAPASAGYYVANATGSTIYLSRRNSYRYNGSAYVKKGITLETAAATNIVPYSNDFDAGLWSLSETTTSASAVLGPDGSSFFQNLDATVVSGGHRAEYNPGSNWMANATVHTISCYFKSKNEIDWVFLGHGETAATVNRVYFDITNGTIGTVSGTFIDYGMEDVGNGIYRVYITVTSSANLDAAGIGLASADNTPSFSGVTDGVLIWGFQVEASSVPTSYIPTTGATATRAAETLTIAAANMAYSSTAMSFQMQGEFNYVDNADSSEVWFLRWEADASNYIYTLLSTASTNVGTIRALQEASGVIDGPAASPSSETSPGINSPFNWATRNTSGSINAASFGGAGTENATPTALPDLSGANAELGYNGGGPYTGTIALFRQWDADIGDTGIELASAA